MSSWRLPETFRGGGAFGAIAEHMNRVSHLLYNMRLFNGVVEMTPNGIYLYPEGTSFPWSQTDFGYSISGADVTINAGDFALGTDAPVSSSNTTLTISVGPPPTHKVWATQSHYTFPVLSDFWPHGAVAQAYGVFNEVTGFANRGSFVVDRGGIIRFAECNEPGEARDPAHWIAALAALTSPRL